MVLGALSVTSQNDLFTQELSRNHFMEVTDMRFEDKKVEFVKVGARRKFADVLYVPQEFSTKLCGKSAERRALSGNVNTL